MAAFTEFVGRNYYTNQQYEIDLSNPASAVQAVTAKTWDMASVVPFSRRSAFPPIGTITSDTHLDFHGFKFNKSGDIWSQPSDYATRLSPDQAWLFLLSATPTGNGGARVFLDLFDANTGQKLFTIEGTFSSLNGGSPDGVLGNTGWVTERYFVVPLGRTLANLRFRT